MNNLRKLLLLILITIISVFFVSNKTYAHVPNQDYHFILRKSEYYRFTRLPDNRNTYEFEVEYKVYVVIPDFDYIGNDYYFFTSHDIPLQKGINRETNAYKVIRFRYPLGYNYSYVALQFTLEKSFVDEYYSLSTSSSKSIERFFSEYSVFYFKFKPDTSSSDYQNGYNNGYNVSVDIGYDDGYPIGYSIGYEDGYIRGLDENYQIGYNVGYDFGKDDGFDKGVEDTVTKYYNEGYNKGFRDWFNDKFNDNFYIWIIPAIILVFVIGIFVSYRKERE